MTAVIELDLALHPDDLATLLRLPEVAGAGERSRAAAVQIMWHDTPELSLAASGLALSERREGRATRWRLERTRPRTTDLWAPGAPATLVAEANVIGELGNGIPQRLMPIAGFEGKARAIDGETLAVHVLAGEVRTLARAHPVCRVALTGPADAVVPLVQSVAQTLRLAVPPTALADEAFATARPPLSARRLGAPSLPGDLSPGDAFAYVAAHLTDVILFYAPLVRAGEAPEPVHQMRVAIRRLRSALALFGKAIACPEIDAVKLELKSLNAVLGPARDWDVFSAGTAANVAAAFPEDAAVTRLTRQAKRRRDSAYAALIAQLDSPAFRALTLHLALLAAIRPWTAETESDLPGFGAKALAKRHGALAAYGDDISDLPTEQLHEIRIDAKRMRYAAELFAPLFPRGATRRFVRRLSILQERLGLLNDGAVAAGLLSEIGQEGRYTGGLVRGFVAAGSVDARRSIGRAWQKFRRSDIFWD